MRRKKTPAAKPHNSLKTNNLGSTHSVAPAIAEAIKNRPPVAAAEHPVLWFG
jgi:hypothetical protein